MATVEVLRTGASWIQKTPEICGGDACIRETRVPVWSVVDTLKSGCKPSELLAYFVTPLTDADVQAAIDYYSQNRQEIEAAIKENQ